MPKASGPAYNHNLVLLMMHSSGCITILSQYIGWFITWSIIVSFLQVNEEGHEQYSTGELNVEGRWKDGSIQAKANPISFTHCEQVAYDKAPSILLT